MEKPDKLNPRAVERVLSHTRSRYGTDPNIERVVAVATRTDITRGEKMRSVGGEYHTAMRYAIKEAEAEFYALGVRYRRDGK